MDPVKVMHLLELIEKTHVIPPEAGMSEDDLQAIRDKAKADIVTEIASKIER